jgi:hypothetical protein
MATSRKPEIYDSKRKRKILDKLTHKKRGCPTKPVRQQNCYACFRKRDKLLPMRLRPTDKHPLSLMGTTDKHPLSLVRRTCQLHVSGMAVDMEIRLISGHRGRQRSAS